MRALLALILFASCVAGCTYHRCSTPARFYIQDEVHAADFPFHLSGVTPKNIAVDVGGQPINPRRIDRIVDEVETCAAALAPGGVLPAEVVSQGSCREERITLPFPRSCMAIKVINNAFISETQFAGSKHQMIPGWVAMGCTEKGMPSGPCYRRSGIINGDTIVTTPSMYLLKDSLVKLYMHCETPWLSPALAKCMTPTTGPLDDGTGP